jgi:uncharacterized membrane protein
MGAMEAIQHLLATRPLIALHLVSALLATVIGAVLLTRRKGTGGHRTLGWIWVVLMANVAFSSLFIRSTNLPNLAGWSPIHLLTLTVLVAVPAAVVAVRRGHVSRHRTAMVSIYIGACVVAGAFTLLPGRFLGDLVWKHTLGLVA